MKLLILTSNRLVQCTDANHATLTSTHYKLLKLIPPSTGLLHGVRWFDTDVSGLPISPIFKGQSVQEEMRT